ncbi:MAG: hypothetical protein ACOCZ5_00535 [bacterium]
MILLLGTKNCGNCNAVKFKLRAMDIEYEYKDFFNELSDKEQGDYIKRLKEKDEGNGSVELPIIVKEGKIIALEDLL